MTVPLHVKVAEWAPCSGYLPVNCIDHRPTVNAPPQTDIVVYLMLHNFTATGSIGIAFDWDPSWTLTEVLANCVPGQLGCAICPQPGGHGGPTEGTLVSAWSCLFGPALRVWARLYFTTGTTGCLYPVRSSYPFGNHVVDCENEIDQFNPDDPGGERRVGRICVEEGGYDACDPVTPVGLATWGQIKASWE